VQDADVVTYVAVCDPGLEGADGPSLHAHVVLGLADGTTRGGHLLEGWVFPTLEVGVTEAPAELRKVMRPDLGIALIDLDRSES
jgi:predicted DNA-binding protein with PD1-like motif